MFLLFGISFIFSSKREGHAYASFGGAGSSLPCEIQLAEYFYKG